MIKKLRLLLTYVFANNNFVSFTERACRFPYDIRYQIQINELGCYSGCGTIGFSVLLLILSIVINYI